MTILPDQPIPGDIDQADPMREVTLTIPLQQAFDLHTFLRLFEGDYGQNVGDFHAALRTALGR